MSHEKSIAQSGLHLGFEIVKIGLKVAAVAAVFCTAKELSNLRKTVEKKHEHHFLSRK